MSALFNDVHGITPTTTDVNDVKLSDLIGGKQAAMLAAYQRHTQRHTSGDVTEDGTPIPEHAFERAEDMTFDPWR